VNSHSAIALQNLLLQNSTKRYTAEQNRTLSVHIETGRAQQQDYASTRAVNCRLLERQKRWHENQTWCDEHVVQSVVGQRQIADDCDRQGRRPERNNQSDEFDKTLRSRILPRVSKKYVPLIFLW